MNGPNDKQQNQVISQFRGRAFTLVEVLVTLAIIAILMAILLPALANVRGSSTELKSVVGLTSMFDTFMPIHVEEHGQLPAWFNDEDGFIRSYLHAEVVEPRPSFLLPVHGFNVEAFEDPFRSAYTIADDPLLARLGPFVNSDHGAEGFGYLYVPMTGSAWFESDEKVRVVNSILHPMWDTQPRDLEWMEPSWTRMNIPKDTQYLLWGVGKNGTLNGDPAKDVVLIKTEQNEGLTRHRPNQTPAAVPISGKEGVEEPG